MDSTFIISWVGFMLAGYSVVGNDSIQTLGTFLSSNEQRPWYVLWLFAGSLLTASLLYSWYYYAGDVSYARLEKYPFPESFGWTYLLPPLTLLLITRFGIPVSTTFIILTFFNPTNLGKMVQKSLTGYVLAFVAAVVIYALIARTLEKRFIENPISPKEQTRWTVLQWLSTSFLWVQWLVQDFANIYAYLPRTLSVQELMVSLIILLTLLAFIFFMRGGNIQKVVKSKVNTVDIRSATIIDFTYGLVLLYFTEVNNIPMSTTWVFVGLLAGRELSLRFRLYREVTMETFRMIGLDLVKIMFGLIISILLVVVMKWLAGETGFF
jgi:phosphate/sulfate permease